MALVVKQITFPHVVSSIYAKFLLDQPTVITASRFEVIFALLDGSTVDELKRLQCGEPIACICTVGEKKLVILTKLNNVFTVEYVFGKNDFVVSPSLHLSSPYHLDDWFSTSQVSHDTRIKTIFGSSQFMESNHGIVAIYTFDGLLSVFTADFQKHLVIPLAYSSVYQLRILDSGQDDEATFLAIVTRDMDLNYLLQVIIVEPNCEGYRMHKHFHIADVPSLMVPLLGGYVYCICDTQHYLFAKDRLNITVSDHCASVKKYRGFVSLPLPYSVRYKKATAFTTLESRRFIFSDSSMGLHSVDLRIKADRLLRWTVTTLRTSFQSFSSLINLGNDFLYGSGGSSPSQVFRIDSSSVQERLLAVMSFSGHLFARSLGDFQMSEICSLDTDWRIELISEKHLDKPYIAVEAGEHIFLHNEKWKAFEDDIEQPIEENLVKFSGHSIATAKGGEFRVYQESKVVMSKTFQSPISGIAISGDKTAVAHGNLVAIYTLGSPNDCKTIRLTTDVFAIAIMGNVTLISDTEGCIHIYKDLRCLLKHSSTPMRLELISVAPQIMFVGANDSCGLFTYDGVSLSDRAITENVLDAAFSKETIVVLKKDVLTRYRLKPSYRIVPRTSHECMVRKIIQMDNHIVALCIKQEVNAETNDLEYTSWACLVEKNSYKVLENVIVGEGGTEILDGCVSCDDLFLLTVSHITGCSCVEFLSVKEGHLSYNHQCELPESAEFSHMFMNQGYLLLSGKGIRWFRIEEDELVAVTPCVIHAPYYFSLCVPFSDFGLVLYDLVHGFFRTKADPYMMVTDPLKFLFKPNAVVTALQKIGQDTFALGDCVGNVEMFKVGDSLERICSINVSDFNINSVENVNGSLLVGTSAGEVFSLVWSPEGLKTEILKQKATVNGWSFIDDDVHLHEQNELISSDYASTSFTFQQRYYPSYLVGGSSDSAIPSSVDVVSEDCLGQRCSS